MKTLLSEYVYKPLQLLCDFLVANNTFSDNFKYPQAGKSQNSFGNMNIKYFYEISFL